MCTVIVAFDPRASDRGAPSLLVAAVRDEMVERAWEWPDRHWPDRPDVIGGRDTREGGTWLAVDTGDSAPRGPRLGAVLNGSSSSAAPAGPAAGAEEVSRLSRGRLPLRVTARPTLDIDRPELRRYQPFHLLAADTERAALYGWDGRDLTEQALPAGVSVLVNTGLDAGDPRARRHGPAFAAAHPHPTHADLRGAREPNAIWGGWPSLVDDAMRGPARTGGDDDHGDPSSLRASVDLGRGRLWATSSVTLVACAPDTVRCAFTDAPGDPRAWRMVL